MLKVAGHRDLRFLFLFREHDACCLLLGRANEEVVGSIDVPAATRICLFSLAREHTRRYEQTHMRCTINECECWEQTNRVESRVAQFGLFINLSIRLLLTVSGSPDDGNYIRMQCRNKTYIYVHTKRTSRFVDDDATVDMMECLTPLVFGSQSAATNKTRSTCKSLGHESVYSPTVGRSLASRYFDQSRKQRALTSHIKTLAAFGILIIQRL